MRSKLKLNLNWIVLTLLVLLLITGWWVLIIPVYMIIVLVLALFGVFVFFQHKGELQFKKRTTQRTSSEFLSYWSSMLIWMVNLYIVLYLGHAFLAFLILLAVIYTLYLYGREPNIERKVKP